MRVIKVLHITFEMKLGGTQQVIRQLVEGIEKGKFESKVFCIDGIIGELGELLQKKGVEVICYRRKPGFDLGLVKVLRDYIITNKIDIVHCHQYSPYVYGVLATYLTKAKIIFTEHGRFYPERSSLKRRLLNPLLSRITDSITAISMATANALSFYEYFPRERIQVIYNGLKLDEELQTAPESIASLKAEINLPVNAYVIGTIARLDPIKNHELILKTIAELKGEVKDIHFLLIGDGVMKKSLVKMAKDLNISNRVTFTGFVVMPQRYLATMDVFVLPSFSEGTSMTLLESMAYKKTSIVTNVGGNPEIVSHELTGLIINNNELSEFKCAILRLFKTPKLKAQLSLAAHERYNKYFRESRMVMEYQDLYKKVMVE